MSLIRHRQEPAEAVPSLFDWGFPARGWWSHLDDLFRDGEGRQVLRVEEFDQDHTLVVRAEMPGIDPDKDVEVTVADGMLTIRAERTEEEETTKKHFHRREIRYGGFSRTLPLPEGVREGDIKASYKDGILEIQVPVPETSDTETTKVPIARAT
jgi:HSP20 family protein